MGKFVAIEIGNKLTKLIYGQDKKDDIQINDYRLLENSDKLFNPDGDLNLNEIHPLLKSAIKEMKIRNADCYLTVGGQSGIVRLREMPMVRLKEMKEIVRFEAEQFLPYNVEAFYIDFRINRVIESVQDSLKKDEENLSDVSKEQIVETMIVAAPKELVDEQVALVDKLKLNIKRVDYYTDAIYCYFRKYILTENKNTLVVDMGHSSTKMTMFNGMKYFANIYSEIGLESLVTRFCEQNGIQKDEAIATLLPILYMTKIETEGETVIHNRLESLRNRLQFKSMENKKQNSFEVEFDNKLERLYEPVGYEVSKMMEFFKTRQFGMSVDEIYLIGGGANMHRFAEFLSYYHNIEVKQLNTLSHLNRIPEHDYQLMIPVIGGLLKGGC